MDPQQCGILCNILQVSIPVCTLYAQNISVFGGCILPSLIYVIFSTLLLEIKYVVFNVLSKFQVRASQFLDKVEIPFIFA